MSAADNLGNLFVALLAGIPLLIFVLFACCACLEASIQAARRSYKPHLPTRVRFADEAETEDNNRRQQQRNPLLFGLRSNRSSNRLEGSGLVAHSSYIQRYPNYRYTTVGQSSGRSTPPPVLKSRTELGSGSLKSPVSPLVETQRLLDHDFCHRTVSTPTRSSLVGSPAYSHSSLPPGAVIPSPPKKGIGGGGVASSPPVGVPGVIVAGKVLTPPAPTVVSVVAGSPATVIPSLKPTPTGTPPPAAAAAILSSKGISSPSSTPAQLPGPGRAVRQDNSSSADTQQTQITKKTSPNTQLASVLSYFDESRRSSTSTPSDPPTFQIRPKSPFEMCGPHVDQQQQRRYSTPSSPTMYAYAQNQDGPSNYSSMSYLPEVRTYLHFMEDDFSNRQRSHSFSGRSKSRSPRKVHPLLVPRSPSPFTLERTMVDDNASKISTPSSFGTTFLTPPGSTDQGSFKSPESGTPEWLLSSDVPPTRFITTAIETDEGGVTYKQLSRSNSIRAATV